MDSKVSIPGSSEVWFRQALRAATAETALIVEPVWHGGELAALLGAKTDLRGSFLRTPLLRAWLPSDASDAARRRGLSATAGIGRALENAPAVRCWESALLWSAEAPVVASVLSRHVTGFEALSARSNVRVAWASRAKVDLHEAADGLARHSVAPFSSLPALGVWDLAALGGLQRPRSSASPAAVLSGSVAAWRVLAPALVRFELESVTVAEETIEPDTSEVDPLTLILAGGLDRVPAPRLSMNIHPGADLRGRSLSGAMLAGLDLRGCDFRYSDLSAADLSNCDLRQADFRNAILSASTLIGSRLAEADFRGADLDHAELDPVELALAQR